jgi:hypothetical protein
MSLKCRLSVFLFVCIVHVSAGLLWAQEDEGEVVIINETVGKEIDREERDKFELFHEVRGFQSAVWLRLPDNDYILKVTYLDDQTGEPTTRRIRQSEKPLNDIRDQIDRFEEGQVRKAKTVYVTIRFGQGGFSDDRSPSGKFAGDQGALDIKLAKLPVAISYLGEVLYGGEFDDESEERIDLWAVNIAHVSKPFRSERINVSLGGGIGRLRIEREWPDGSKVKTPACTLYNLEAGVNVRAFWVIGFYIVGKYSYAQKKTDKAKVVDFKESGFFFGLTVNVGI